MPGRRPSMSPGWTATRATRADRGDRGDRGETLLELLVAVVIMGVGVVAVIGGITVGVLLSDVHRKQATAGAAVRDFAEAVQTLLVSGGYVSCATVSSYADPPGYRTPAGYTSTVVAGSLRYWTGTAWQTTCGIDLGLQQLTLQVRSNDGRASEQVVVVVRKPCRVTDPLCG
jgi:Tfp pilus assembly protein PilV